MANDKSWKLDKDISLRTCLNIVSNASLMSMHVANGKNIPLIIVNTTNHYDIEQAILFHEGIQNGHAKSIWGKKLTGEKVTLTFTFLDPVPIQFMVNFNVVKDWLIVDMIINSQLLYIQPGKPKDRLADTIDAQRLLVEVPSTHFNNEWKKIFTKNMEKHFINHGLRKKEAKLAVSKLYNDIDKYKNLRLK